MELAYPPWWLIRVRLEEVKREMGWLWCACGLAAAIGVSRENGKEAELRDGPRGGCDGWCRGGAGSLRVAGGDGGEVLVRERQELGANKRVDLAQI